MYTYSHPLYEIVDELHKIMLLFYYMYPHCFALYFVFAFLSLQQQFPIALCRESSFLVDFLLLLFIYLFVCLFPGSGLLHVWDYWGCGKNKYNFYWVMAHTSIEIFSILNNSIDFTKSFIYSSNKTWREQIKTHFHHWILYKFTVLV